MPALPTAEEALENYHISSQYDDARRLYEIILAAEAAAQAAGHEKHLIDARVVGYLFLHPSIGQDHSAVRAEIVSCKDHPNLHEALYELGGLYIDHVLTLCEPLSPTSDIQIREIDLAQLESPIMSFRHVRIHLRGPLSTAC